MSTDDTNGAIPADLIAAAAADASNTPSPPTPGNTAGDAAPGAASSPAAPIDHTAEARDFISFANSICVPVWPSLATIYTDTVRENIAVRLGAVFKKYDVTMAGLFGRYGDEFMLALALLPLAMPTVQAIKHDNAQARAKAQQQEQNPGADDGGRQNNATGQQPSAESPLSRFPDANAKA